MPSARISGLFGSQTMPPDIPVDPPTRACFSTTSGSIPAVERRQRGDHSAAAAARDQQVDGLVPLVMVIGAYAFGQPEVGDRHVDGGVRLLDRGHQLLVGQAGEEAVDDALEVRDQPFDLVRQPHVLESLGVQAFLLPRQVGEVLRGDRRPARVVGRQRLRRRGLARARGRSGSG